MARRKRRKRDAVQDDTPPRRRRRFRWWFLAAGAGLCLLLAALFAPMLIGMPSFRDAMIFDRITGDTGWKIRCDQARGAWWAGLELRGVRVTAPDGEEVISIQRVAAQRSLAQWVRSRQQLGLIHIDGPRLRAEIRPGGSRWEDLLQQLPPSTNDSSSHGPRMNLEIQDAQVEVIPTGLSNWEVHSCDVSVGVRANGIQIEANGIAAHETQAGKIQLSAEIPTEPSAAWELKTRLAQVPLIVVDTVAMRFQQSVATSGTVNGQVQLVTTEAGPELTGTLQCRQLAIRATDYIGSDVLATPHLSTQFEVRLRGDQLDVRDASLKCDLIDLEGQGTLALHPSGSVWKTLHDGQYTLRGRLDVARVSGQLVETLRRRTDSSITEGHVRWELSNQTSEQQREIAGELTSLGLRIRRPDQKLEFIQPMEVSFRAVESQGSWRLDELTGRSTFLAFTGRGDSSNGQLAIRGDLQQLRSELAQFMDLGGLRLGGVVDGQLQWQANEQGQVVAQGSLNANEVNVAVSHRMWREPTMDVRFDAVAQLHNRRLQDCLSGTIQLQAGEDELTAKLSEPMRLGAGQWPLDLELRGDLSRWRQRLRGLVRFPVPPIEGQIETQLALRRDGPVYRIQIPTTDIQQLELQLPGHRIREPRIRLEGQAEWDAATATLQLADTSFASTSLALRVGTLKLNTRAGGMPQGQLSYRGDLTRIWQLVPGRQRTQRPSGSIAGMLALAPGGEGQTRFQGEANLQDFRWLQRAPKATRSNRPKDNWQSVWHEPRIEIQSQGAFAPGLTRVQFDQLQMGSSVVQLQAQGDVVEPLGRPRLNLRGQTQLNLDDLSKRLQPTWGQQLRLAGQVAKPFAVSGPLQPGPERMRPVSTSESPQAAWISPDLQAQGGIGWDQVHAWGFDFTPGSVDLKLERQHVFVLPIHLQTSGGSIRFTPRVRLDGIARVEIEPGQVIEQVQITPQMCHGWLKYVAPLLADVAAAQGTFSMTLAGATLPLAQPTQSNIDGTLQIHAAQVGPGATSQQLLGLIQQIKAITRASGGAQQGDANNWIMVPQQDVTFQMRDGKVHHQNLTLVIGNVPVQTSGWVGLDERMSLVARLPIQDSWVANDRWLSGLKGQSIDIPIRGTLQQPRIDRSVLNNLTTKTLQQGAESLLQQEVQKQLNRLFE